MESILTVIHIVASIVMVVVILLQSGKGSGLAASFGGASAGTEVFGGSGAGGFLVKATVVLGGIYMATSLSLAYLSSQPKSTMSLEGSEETQIQEDEIIDADEVDPEELEDPDNEDVDGPAPAPGGGAMPGQ